ncbi:MAG: site-2 protease family protein, partial [Acidobacteria bacterium]|nr:site-2 protease family protein [Acidobacteriota bacterium]
DYRWFPVFALCLWLIAFNLQHGGMRLPVQKGPGALPPIEGLAAWFYSAITTLALFLSVFGHELSHALMGRAEGIEIEEIVLHPFGGLARLKREPDSPRAEFRIAIAGPAASFLFSVLALGAMLLAAKSNLMTAALVFFIVGSGNLLLAVFNLFPGYPLDGGRVLRAIMWHKSGNIVEATRRAGFCGMLIAGALIIFGIHMMTWPALLMGLWSVLVGLFLLDAANKVVKQARGSKAISVSEAMSAPVAIEPDLLVSHFVDTILPLHRQTSFPVAHQRRLYGILTLEDLKAQPRERWPRLRARDVMRPVSDQLFVAPSVSMIRAQEIMQQNGTGSLAVVDGSGELVGFLHRKARMKAEG